MEGGVEYGENNLESRQSDHSSASSQKWLKVISGEGRIIFCPFSLPPGLLEHSCIQRKPLGAYRKRP